MLKQFLDNRNMEEEKKDDMDDFKNSTRAGRR